jgi:hypothetical protein
VDDDKKLIRILQIPRGGSTTTSATTATSLFGGEIWHAPQPQAERPAADDPVYSYIGQVASDWASVEQIFDLIIADLAGIERHVSACVTAQMMGVYPRCRAIIALLTVRERRSGTSMKKLIDTTTRLLGASNGPGEKRNRIVHDAWYVFSGSDRTGQFKSMPHKDLRYGIHPVDRKDLETALAEIADFKKRVEAYRADIVEMLAASL